MNLPMYLTWLRILAIPIVVLVYFLPFHFAHPLASAIFAIAAFTDWLDGYLARALNLSTPLGAFLDPVADKLLVATALVLLVNSRLIPFVSVPAMIIIGREITISALREWMAEIGQRRHVAVAFMGKVKTTVQLIALILLLWVNKSSPRSLIYLGVVALWIAALLTLWSMVQYLQLAWGDLVPSRKNEKP
jgi:CDP-diacylglycerol--glycerol-3-phosphate 3-phosphatidyltransferase